MNRRHEAMVAHALEADIGLLPYLPELLRDLEELGSDAELVTAVIEGLALGEDARVTDLGCGKGATAFEIAQSLGYDVTGIDLFEPFVEHCTRVAKEEGLADRCRFIHGDVMELTNQLDPADVAVFAALGDVIGTLDQAIPVIRQYVKRGGFMVISDCYIRAGGTSNFPGFEQYRSLDKTVAQLTSTGDVLIQQVAENDDNQTGVDEEDEVALIAARAEEIATRYPEAAESVRAFASSQAEENTYIEANLVDAIWVLQKN